MKRIKLFKKIITGFITACMVVSASSVTAFAADTANLNETGSAGSTTVRYTIDSGWTATIPAYINPSEQGNADVEKYSVTISDVMLGSGGTLVGTVEYNGKLAEANDIELGYVLCDADGEIVTNKEIIYADAGNPDSETTYTFGAELNEKPKYAGNYSGTATFHFAANEKVFTIGETKPENVIAKFNEDYSEVDIFTAGNDSDGIMKDFNGDSPMQEQSTELKAAAIESGVTKIGSQAFNACSNLTDISIPSTVISIGSDSFNECDSLNTVYGSYGSLAESWSNDNHYNFVNTTVYTIEEIRNNDHLFAIGKTKPEYVVAEFNDDFTEVNIFANGEDSDGIMNSFDDWKNISPMYRNKSTLKSAAVKNGVTNISTNAFDSCNLLESIDIANSVVSIGNRAFQNCSSLADINIPNGVVTIGDSAFLNCRSLNNISIPDSVASIEGRAFENCGSLTSIKIPNSITSIEDSLFYNCYKLTSVSLPNSIVSIGNKSFYGCSSLENINIPDSVTSISAGAFEGCGALKSINIPDRVSLINVNTFFRCNSLSEITIGRNVASVEGNAFAYCYNLETVFGYTGSYAETWANSNGYTFTAID